MVKLKHVSIGFALAAMFLAGPIAAQTGPNGNTPNSGSLSSEIRLAAIEQREKDSAVAREIADLSAQQSMATSAGSLLRPSWAQVWIGGAGLLGLIASLAFNGWSLFQTRSALTSQKDTAQSQMRAYLGIERVRLDDFEVGKRPTVRVFIKNYGSTPAYNVQEKLTVKIVPKGGEANLTCSDLESGVTVNPDQTTVSAASAGAILDQKSFDKFKGHDVRSGDAISIVGEITYETFGKKRTVKYAQIKYGHEAQRHMLIPNENWSD